MNYNIETFKRNMPSVNSSYGALDIVGQTLGRFLDYKKETAMIEHATEQLRYQTDVIIKRIDAQLQISLDENEKNYKLEMKRLKMVAKSIKESRKNEKAMINHIRELTKQLSDPNTPTEIKQAIPQLIAYAHQTLSTTLSKSDLAIGTMGSIQSNQNLIEG